MQGTEGSRGSGTHGGPVDRREAGVGYRRQGHRTEAEDNASSGAEIMTKV